MKRWYTSKLVWLGIIQFVMGVAMQVAEFIETADFSPTAIAAIVLGVLTVVLRVWFTSEPVV